MRSGNEYAVRVCYKFLSFRSNRIITGQFVKPRPSYASYFRLKTQMVRLISGANELFYDRFPYKWENGAIFFLRKAQTIGRLLS